MVRLNITMPDDVAHELVHVRNKSRFIADAVREKIERDKKMRVEQMMIEGYRESYQEDRDINREWETTDEGWA